MNYRYVPDANGVLRTILERRPSATIYDIRKSDPILRSMSVDHLSLLLQRMGASLARAE